MGFTIEFRNADVTKSISTPITILNAGTTLRTHKKGSLIKHSPKLFSSGESQEKVDAASEVTDRAFHQYGSFTHYTIHLFDCRSTLQKIEKKVLLIFKYLSDERYFIFYICHIILTWVDRQNPEFSIPVGGRKLRHAKLASLASSRLVSLYPFTQNLKLSP